MRTVSAPMVFADAVKNERPKSADNTSRKDDTWPSPIPMEGIPMEGIRTTTAPLQYVAQISQISLAILLLCKPATPTRCHTMVEPCPASPFPQGTRFPRLTCSLSQIHLEIIQAIFSDDPVHQLVATKIFRKRLSKEDPPIDRIIACGVVPRFVEFLARPHFALPVR